MAVLTLQIFVSLILVLGSLLLFGVSLKNRDHEHADRLSLLPMNDDDPPAAHPPPSPRKETHGDPNPRL